MPPVSPVPQGTQCLRNLWEADRAAFLRNPITRELDPISFRTLSDEDLQLYLTTMSSFFRVEKTVAAWLHDPRPLPRVIWGISPSL